MKPVVDSKEILIAAQNHPPATRPCRGFTLIELLVVMAIIGIVTAILLPVVRRTKAKAQNAVCVNNLRQLGIAVRSYTGDNNDRLPAAERLPTQPADPQHPLPRICDVLACYIGQTAGANTNTISVCKCPMDRAGLFASEGSSYEWNTDLNDHRIDEIQTAQFQLKTRTIGRDGGQGSTATTNVVLRFVPETTPLFIDYRDFHPRAPKSGKNVVFMDGHVAPQ